MEKKEYTQWENRKFLHLGKLFNTAMSRGRKKTCPVTFQAHLPIVHGSSIGRSS